MKSSFDQLINKGKFLFTILYTISISWQVNSQTYIKTGTCEFRNGMWYNGQDFEKKTFYTEGGFLRSTKPDRVDTVIDLSGRFVVPPFGEAHNHNVDNPSIFYPILLKYLKAGIFYVKNPGALDPAAPGMVKQRLAEARLINNDTAIDAVFSLGPITGEKGHPWLIAIRNFKIGAFTEKEAEDDFYYFVTSAEMLNRKWPVLLQKKPDFIKTVLVFSEEYEKRKNDTAYIGYRGLDPLLLPLVVKKAHKAGLRVSVHIETSADFHVAVMAGVDEINHTPGFRLDPLLGDSRKKESYGGPIDIFMINSADATLAAKKNIFVVTTLGGTLKAIGPVRRLCDSLYTHNLTILKNAGVRIAIGSDSYRSNSWDEIEYLLTINVFTKTELLNMFCTTTAQTIYPKRKIGYLKNRFESNFLVFDFDPLPDIMKMKEVKFAMKGRALMIF